MLINTWSCLLTSEVHKLQLNRTVCCPERWETRRDQDEEDWDRLWFKSGLLQLDLVHIKLRIIWLNLKVSNNRSMIRLQLMYCCSWEERWFFLHCSIQTQTQFMPQKTLDFMGHMIRVAWNWVDQGKVLCWSQLEFYKKQVSLNHASIKADGEQDGRDEGETGSRAEQTELQGDEM